MTTQKRFIILSGVIAAAIGLFSAYYINVHLQIGQSSSGQSVVGQQRPAFTLNNLQGEPISISKFDDKVVLLNFWAAWCPPCRREIPAFSEVREFFGDSGFEVIGIAIDDKPAVKKFLDAHPQVKYPQLIGQNDAVEVAKQFGNKRGGLPYSVIYDRDGIVHFVKAGELHKDELINLIEPLL